MSPLLSLPHPHYSVLGHYLFEFSLFPLEFFFFSAVPLVSRTVPGTEQTFIKDLPNE